MNVLVLIPRSRRLEYAFFAASRREALLESRLDTSTSDEQAVCQALGRVRSDCEARGCGGIDLAVIRAAYGGSAFAATARVDVESLSRLAALAEEAPMHVPPVCLLARASLQAFGASAVLMAFETAFFVALPVRERRYAIADDRVRRFGHHGLFHQAAAMEPEGAGGGGAARTLSLCLEPQPELAAIMAGRPVMVTGGATPLEGLPGETTCGDLDPTIILTLAREMKWGPEQINNVLTRQSGLRGLLGRPMRLGRLIGSSRWASADGRLRQAPEGTLAAARGFVAYRILLAAGAGVAAMGGFDRLVLTGRYGAEGQAMSRQLVERLCQANGRTERPPVIVCPTPLSRIVADQAVATALQETGEFRRPESAEAIPMNAPSA